MCDSPNENIAQGAQWLFYLSATRVRATAADTHLGSPVGTFGHLFRLCSPLCACTVAVVPQCGHFCTQRGAKDAPRCPKGAKREPKSSLLGAQSVTFGCRPGESGPLCVKTSAGAMFSSHYERPGPSFFAPKIDSGTQCRPEGIFFTLLCPL